MDWGRGKRSWAWLGDRAGSGRSEGTRAGHRERGGAIGECWGHQDKATRRLEKACKDASREVRTGGGGSP